MGSKSINVIVMSTENKGDIPECHIEFQGLQ